ncbi:hypothetical protein V2J09_000800 [Rumex salicifolius]
MEGRRGQNGVLEMEASSLLWITAALTVAVVMVLKRVNWLVYEVVRLGEKRHNLPPGDLGWPFVGNMLSFLRALRDSHPESFMSSYFTRYGKTGIYKAFMFGRATVIVMSGEICRRVLTDNKNFKSAWPASTKRLIGEKSFVSIGEEEHKRLRRLTAGSINSPEALSNYIPLIEDLSRASLEEWSRSNVDVELFPLIRKLAFRIFMSIFLSSEGESVADALENEYAHLNNGVRAMAINLPGFAFHTALKARKRLVGVFESIVERRRSGRSMASKKDMMDGLLDVEDEDGRRLSDEEIIDIMLMYLYAGHESSGHAITWATILLQEHPQALQAAKAEAERIVKNRPPTQQGLSLKEIRQMEYISKVIDETLRWLSFSLMAFREAKNDVNINGYTIPKGWNVMTWFSGVHLDPEIYPQPFQFDPSRWDGIKPKASAFLPFGAGTRFCPGNDIAKLEISIFLHYFLLGYRLERKNPCCPSLYLPHPRPRDNCLAKIIKVSTHDHLNS